jgi:hypothetical protein
MVIFMKKRKICIGLITILIMTFIFTACAKSSMKSTDNSSNSTAGTEAGNGFALPEEAAADINKEKASSDGSSTITNTSAVSSEVPSAGTLDKIIRRVSMSVETQEFDVLISKINEQINRLGGYVESSQITGKRYYYDDDSRYGNIVARIPKKRTDEFINAVYDTSNVVDRSESTENITLQYIDAESRKKALEVEQDRLLALLEKTETLEDILVLETKLSDIRYELQKYDIQLRTYDNLVEYSTVTLNITEVERITPATKEKKTFWERIQTGFGNSIYHIGKGLQNFLVWFIVNLPYLLIWAVLIAGIVLIIRRIYRKYNPRERINYDQDQNVYPNPNRNQGQDINHNQNIDQNKNGNSN